MTLRADAVLFDKDGTLFEFGATWDAWGKRTLRALSQGNTALLHALAAATCYDLEHETFLPESPVVAGTNRQTAECLATALPGRSADEVETYLLGTADDAPLVETVPLCGFMAQLGALGLRLGVMTNDAESAARVHLRKAGIEQAFAFIAGFDSGHGAKPDPAPLLAFAAATGIAPARIAMVGDSPHDLVAGRAAGMQTVAVLTGPIRTDRLAPHADVVLPDIGHLPGWLAT
ncbi:phosphatase [Salipiger aestuarii]|uniref:phosphoglycolate phosphatase n=1 Tax=Salipiger aestuarii TaxID=568098 RepID=A0A327Y9U6_9RHOB|nr:HAD family hydrolase [Salipiger aestuarii]EIE52703.1 HAD family hydrolase [Citreicella sp. 357]KAA8607419.1 phosphatase [Salipiger aestuarii]KAA8612095.1 phosphatase [Salipiger aestuarii]KAB2541728.1 phosphatase [Salipiger aestuarii]RAK17277.1 phosphoglycolate phosphatase [Salipiger aestuarii]